MQKEKAIICDLDGTLTNCDHRVHLAKRRRWDEFFAGIPHDTVNDWCLKMMLDYQAQGYTILFVTGRPANQAKISMDWIHKHTPFKVVMGANLFMRPLNDRRPDFIVKEEIFDKFIKPRYDVELAADDKRSIVDLWNRLGIKTHYCGKDDAE